MSLKSIKKIKNLKSKRVLIRVDTNVPIEKGKIVDDTRIREIIPTLKFLLQKKAKVIVVAHLGRPEGKNVTALKLDPIAERLSKLLKKKVKKLNDFKGQEVASTVEKMKAGEVLMLENIRFSPDESGNKGTLGKELASLADFFVQDGFSVCHRADASVVGLAKYLPSYAGLLLEKEIKALEAVTKKPKRPLLAIIGGAKMETKVPVLQNISKIADAVLVGGGIVNTFLLSLGYEVGASLVDKDQLTIAKKLARKKNIFLPLDVVVGTRDGKNWRVVTIEKKPHKICEPNEAIFDLGPATIERLRVSLPAAKTIVWNGALGYFEQPPYNEATYALAKMLGNASRKGTFTVAGGGETVEVLAALKLTKKISFMSTAGGAMLEFLSGKKLPGIKVLEK